MIHVRIDSHGNVKMRVKPEKSVYMRFKVKGHRVATRYYINENLAILDALEIESKHENVKIVIRDDITNNVLFRN